MAFNGNRSNEGRGIGRSFYHAYCGIKYVCSTERNMKIHLFAALVVISFGLYVELSKAEWLIILLVIAGMFALETINTAIEATVDLVTKEYHPLAKRAKDVAAGAVLIFTIFAIGIGFIIFFPYVIQIIGLH